jgi:hypothetical protein
VAVPSGHISSFVQTRGSIPLFWKQVVNVQYKPKLLIEQRGDTETMSAFKKHFDMQFDIYSKQIVINLINKEGYEEPLSREFARYVELLNDPRIRYLW